MQFHPFAQRFLALVLTAAFMAAAALSGFAVYAMPIQAAYPQESIYLFDADTGEALVEQNPDLPRCVASLTKTDRRYRCALPLLFRIPQYRQSFLQ